MILPKKLKCAINCYYAFQGQGFKHQTLSTQATKTACLDNINKICTDHGIGFCAAAGTMWFVKGKQKCQVSNPFLI